MPQDSVDSTLPLTSAQSGVWASQKLDPANPRYNCGSYLELHGPVNAALLDSAVRIAMTEAEALRVRFVDSADGGPRQEVAPLAGDYLETLDVSDAPDPRKAAVGWMRDDLSRPVDLTSGRLVRHVLVHEGPGSRLLYLRYHHIVMDGLGQTAHLRRIADVYSSLAEGVRPSPARSLPLRDLVDADLAYADSDDHRRDRAYWLARFEDRPDPVSLGDRHANSQSGLLRHTTDLSEDDVALLRIAAEKLDARPSALLVAAVVAYQCGVTARSETMLRIPLPARHSGAAIMTPAMCVNELPVRFTAPRTTTFGNLVADVAAELGDTLRYQRYRGEELRREVYGREGRHQIGGTTVNVVTFDSELSFAGSPATAHHLSSGPVDDLQLDFFSDARATRVRLNVDANPLCHGAGAPAAHSRRLLALMRDAFTEPDRPVGSISLMDGGERRAVAARSAPRAREYDLGVSLHGLVEAQAVRTPDAVAAQTSGATMTYGELVDRARRIAAFLNGQGVARGSVVGVCGERSLDLVASLLGVLMSGASYLPLDPELPASRLEFQIKDAQVRLVLSASGPTAGVAGAGAAVVPVGEALTRWNTADDALARTEPGDAAYVIYTSGSTGTPKGVVVPHRGVVNRLLWMQDEYRLTAEDRVLQKTPFTFDVSVWEFFWPLIVGARLHLAEPGAHRDPRALAAIMADHGVTTAHFVPPMLDAFLSEPAASEPPDLRRVFCSGEALRPETVARFLSRYGSGPDAPALYNLYGPTEASIDVTHWRCTERDTAGPVPIGRAVANTGLYVLGPGGEPMPFGVRGELHIGGVQVASGYLNRPELTAERFPPDPFQPGGAMYRTGDLAVMREDGVLEYHGRVDDQVKVRGFRVEPGEIESALLDVDGVEGAVVTARRQDDGRQRLLAHVVAPRVEVEALERGLRARLPDYMVPSAVIRLESLPLLPNGKVDRGSLPDPVGAPVPEPAGERGATTAEQLVHDAFATVLGLTETAFDASFFSLGGDSILSIQMRAVLERSGLTFDLPDLYDAPTVRALASRTRPHTPAAARPGPFSLLSDADRGRLPRGLEDAYPLSVLQSGMVFHADYEQDSSVYRVVTSIRVRLPFDERAMRRALEGTFHRHPALRSSVHLTGYGEPLQLVHQDVRVPLEVDASLLGTDTAFRERSLHAWAETVKYRAFDLAQAPLLSFTAHPLDGDSFQLGVVEHHVVLDGWSDAAMLDEIVARYRAAIGGEDLWLPAVPSTFRDFVAAERTALADEEHRAFWARELAGAESAPLPRRPHGPDSAARHRRFDVRVDEATGAAITAAARRCRLPVKSLLAAAHAVVLDTVTPGAEVLTGVVTHGRLEEEGGDQAIGVFLNTLPLRLAVGGRTWLELARRIHAHEQRTSPHRRYPYAQILQDHGGLSLDSYVNFMDFHRQWGSDHAVQDGFGIAETNFPLAANFLVDPAGGRLGLWLDCDTAVLDPEFCGRLTGYFERALAALAADADAPPPRDLRGGEELRLLREWEDTAIPYDDGATVDGLILRQARSEPEAIALRDGRQRLDYRELDARSNRLARHLRARGVGRGSRVGVCLRRSADLVVALLAVVRSGAAYVPMDPDFPEDRLRYIAEDAAVDCVVVDAATEAHGGPATGAVVHLVDHAEAIAATSAEPLDSRAGPKDPVYVIYTSGSTGRPKGTVLLHRNVVNFFTGMDRAIGLDSDDVVLALTSVSFDISVLELLWPLSRGATVVVAEERMIERLTTADGDRSLTDLVRRHGVTLTQATPSFMAAVAAQQEALDSLRPLRALLVGGEAFPSGLARRLMGALPEVRVCNMYGPTETTIWSTVHELDPDRDADASTLPIGRPIANTSVRIMMDDDREAPIGVAGELWIGGDGVADGYLGRPELTAERFVDGPAGRAYRTGDRVRRRSDGVLEFLGRVDRQVKILGHRIEPDEVESVLSRHPEVASVAVVAVERAGGGAELVSYVAPVASGGGGEREASHLDRWRDVWDERYTPGSERVDHAAAGDFAGWVSSYTRRPIPEAEMTEWLDSTLERVRAIGADRVVDVGVGVGLYLRALAPQAQSYVGIDLSPAALSRAGASIRVGDRLPDHVTLIQGDASALAERPSASADLVFFNSVVQYFPSVDYLRQVLTEALRVAGPAGAVFVGDVRDLSLLPAFHADTQVRRAPALSSAGETAAAADRSLNDERELCLNTDFFTDFAATAGVQASIELKRGRSANELTRFRWDATLYGPEHPRRPDASREGVELPWREIGGCEALSERLADLEGDRTLTVTAVPNQRLQRPLAAVSALLDRSGVERTAWDVERLIWEADTGEAVHPEDLAALAAEHGRTALLRPTAAGPLGSFDAVFGCAPTATPQHGKRHAL